MSKLEKLRALERSERLSGNSALADNLLSKIASLENNSGLVPVQKVNDGDARKRVEQAWSAIAPDTIVDVLCVIPGVSRKIRRTMPMSEAIIELTKNGAWLVGRTADLVQVQATTENTPRLVPDAANNSQLYI